MITLTQIIIIIHYVLPCKHFSRPTTTKATDNGNSPPVYLVNCQPLHLAKDLYDSLTTQLDPATSTNQKNKDIKQRNGKPKTHIYSIIVKKIKSPKDSCKEDLNLFALEIAIKNSKFGARVATVQSTAPPTNDAECAPAADSRGGPHLPKAHNTQILVAGLASPMDTPISKP